MDTENSNFDLKISGFGRLKDCMPMDDSNKLWTINKKDLDITQNIKKLTIKQFMGFRKALFYTQFTSITIFLMTGKNFIFQLIIRMVFVVGNRLYQVNRALKNVRHQQLLFGIHILDQLLPKQWNLFRISSQSAQTYSLISEYMHVFCSFSYLSQYNSTEAEFVQEYNQFYPNCDHPLVVGKEAHKIIGEQKECSFREGFMEMLQSPHDNNFLKLNHLSSACDSRSKT